VVTYQGGLGRIGDLYQCPADKAAGLGVQAVGVLAHEELEEHQHLPHLNKLPAQGSELSVDVPLFS
jgi:hypothetical protein